MDDMKIKALLIEDNVDDASAIKTALMRAKNVSFDLEWRTNLSEGLDALGNADIDVVLLGISSPGIQGIESLLKAKDEAPTIPILVLTEDDDDMLPAIALQYGAQDCLVKSRMDSDQLARSVQYAIERTRVEESERLRTQELDALVSVASILAEPGAFEQKSRRVLEVLADAVDAEWVALRVFEEDVQGLRLVAMIGAGLDDSPPPAVLHRGELISGGAFEQGEPIVINDYPSYPKADPIRVSHGVKSAVSLLLRVGGKLVGTINVNSREPDHFTPQRLKLLTAIADGMGTLLDNANLLDNVRESEEKYRSLFEDSQDAIFVAHKHVIIDVNEAALNLFGFTREQATGFDVSDIFVNQSEHELFDSEINAKGAVRDFEVRFRRTDGTEIDCLMTAARQYTASGDSMGIQGIVRDITEHKRAEEALRDSEEEARRLAQENAVMAEIGRIITSSLDIDAVYDRFAEQVRRLIPFDRIAINTIDMEGRSFTEAYITGVDVPGRRIGDTMPFAGKLTGSVAQSRSSKLVQTDNIAELNDEFPGLMPEFQRGVRSFLSIPLISGDDVIGALHLRSTTSNAYTDSDVSLIERVGAQIAGAIANAQLYAERQTAEMRLTSSLEEKEALIEEVQQLYGQERRRTDQMRAIHDVAVKTGSILSLQELLPYVVTLVKDTFRLYNVNIGLIEEDTGELAIYAGAGGYKSGPPIGMKFDLDGPGICAWAAKTGEAKIVNDVSKEPRYIPLDDLRETKSELAVPINVGDRVAGILDIQSTELNAFDGEDLFNAQILANQLAVAIENARLFDETRDLAVLEERNRMAREIHDTMAQGFTGIVLQLEAAEQAYGETTGEVHDHLDRAKNLARECLQEARRSVWNLLPKALEQRRLEDAIEQEVNQFATMGDVAAIFDVSGNRRDLTPEAQTTLLRVCQESLTNIRKHAEATKVDVSLAFERDQVRLRVHDNGIGFDADARGKSSGRGGFGLIGMEQRAQLQRGSLTISSFKGDGTTIEILIPTE